MSGPANFAALLRLRAEDAFATRGYTFPEAGAAGADLKLTYAELDARARAIASRLLRDKASDSRALLVFDTTPECVAAFFGCLYAGVTVVPAYSPNPMRPLPGLAHLERVARSSEARFLIGPSFTMARLDALIGGSPGLSSLERIDVDAPHATDSFREISIEGDRIALIQYTSGSTSEPRGVSLSHRNLIENARFIRQAFDLSDQDYAVSWLPPHHDMGLMGGILEPLFLGCEVVLLSPGTFVRRPISFLKAITRFRGTCGGGPSFAYELLTRRVSVAAREELDLSSWRVAFCGSEPVRASTLEAFAQAFEPVGFRRESFLSCYGLAEATLLVSATAPSSFPERRTVDTRRIVSCGRPPEGIQAVVVDPKTHNQCAEGAEGEIWVRGSNVSSGYWGDAMATKEVFDVRLNGGEAGYLRTGDLGFISSAELYVTGRLKDLMIIRGRNLFPQDVEHTVEKAHEAVRVGRVAAFSVEIDETDHLIVVCEIVQRDRENCEAVESAIRTAVVNDHGVVPQSVVLLRASEFPRTSSGKPRRSFCKEQFLEGAWADLRVASL